MASVLSEMNGAFFGEAKCTSITVEIKRKQCKVRYSIICKTRCRLVLKNSRTKVKYKFNLLVDGRTRYKNIQLPEVGDYEMYVSNRKSDYVQYDVQLLDE